MLVFVSEFKGYACRCIEVENVIVSRDRDDNRSEVPWVISGFFFHVGERFANHFLVSKNGGSDKQLVFPKEFVVTRVEFVQLFAESFNNRLE